MLLLFSCADAALEQAEGQFEVAQYKGPVTIDGQWEFYPGKHIAPVDFENVPVEAVTYIDVPSSWTSGDHPLFGKATYRSVVEVADLRRPGVLLPKTFSAARLWVNGDLIHEQGKIDSQNHEALVLQQLAPTVVADRYEIIIQVTNQEFWKAGLVEAPRIGEYEDLFYHIQARSSMYLFWIGCLCLMTLLHLTLFASSTKVYPYLFAGLFGFALLLRITVLGDHFIYHYLKTSGLLSATLQIKAYFASLALMLGIGGVYVREIYKVEKFERWTHYVALFFFGMAALFLVLPPSWYVPGHWAIDIFVALGIGWLLAYIIVGARKDGSIVQLVVVSLLVLTALVDFVALLGGSEPGLIYMGLSVFLLVQFLYISEQYGIAFLRVKRRNSALDLMVRDRTRTIIAQKEELESQAKRLEAMDAAKNRFYENVNHDLRTPLMLIDGYLDRIRTDENTYLSSQSETDFQKLSRNLSLIRNLNDQMNDLVLLENQMLELDFQKVNLAQFIRGIVDLFVPKAEAEGKTLKYKSNVRDSIVVHFDEHQFSRVLYNIMNYALNHTPEDGTILVLLQMHKTEDWFTLGIYNTGDAIAQDVLPKLFDRFYQMEAQQVRSNVKGMGIGLELAKEITLLHGGSIVADSLSKQGTCFFVSLPVNLDKEVTSTGFQIEGSYYELPQPASKRSTDTIKVEAKKANILVVDDNQEIRDYIRDILGQEYGIDEAENGREALVKIDKGFYDLVISDIMMPWMDGFELMEQLNNEKYKGIPILIVSARTSESDKMKVLDDGALDFLTKPFNPKELSQRVANILKYRDNWNAYEDLNHKHKTQIEKDLLTKLQTLVHEHIDDPKLSVAMIAGELCMAERSCYRMIKTLTDKTPLEYIKSVRYEYAYNLLSKHKVNSISEAARLIGISNATYFSNQFKKRYNVYPDGLLH